MRDNVAKEVMSIGTGGSKMETIIYILTAIYVAMILIFITSVALFWLLLAVALLVEKIISSIMKKFREED